MPIRSAWLLNRSDDDGTGTGTGQSRTDTRLAPLGAMTPTGRLTTRGGVLPGSPDGKYVLSGLYVYGQSAGMTATVASGRAVIHSSEAAGSYPVAVTEYTQLLVDDGDPANPRLDLVVLRVYDEAQDAGGRTEAALEIVRGTPAATPAAPAIPAASLALATIRVPAGASAGSGGIDWSSAVADLRRTTVAVGGILPEEWARDIPGAYPGQYRDTGAEGLQRWDGAAWQPYPALPRWRDWTPVWTTSTGLATPSFGNAALRCRYVQLGTVVHGSFDIVFGTTTRFGGGTSADNWRLSLPVTAASLSQAVGFAGLQASTRERVTARLRTTTTRTLELEISSGSVDTTPVLNSGLADAITPWTWGSGMRISGTFTYEAEVAL
ncbi:hypothetical protein [Streptomyces corynorhini]|uniref:Uncharacterized protein n=1 Tax=Streptomyces corynorhini TaxID=2282652 RepID=A0A370B9J8_9ACTN|nr:hypothetical protein [Streptomyces corynorhini]RDG38478.1 hypothetical protein DVH02_08970 [Streptomyces corynorhini]